MVTLHIGVFSLGFGKSVFQREYLFEGPIACFIQLEDGGKLDFGQQQEPTDGNDNAVFPIQSLGGRQPKVEPQEQPEGHLEEHIHKGKERALCYLKSSRQKDDLSEHNRLEHKEIGLIEFHCDLEGKRREQRSSLPL